MWTLAAPEDAAQRSAARRRAVARGMAPDPTMSGRSASMSRTTTRWNAAGAPRRRVGGGGLGLRRGRGEGVSSVRPIPKKPAEKRAAPTATRETRRPAGRHLGHPIFRADSKTVVSLSLFYVDEGLITC